LPVQATLSKLITYYMLTSSGQLNLLSSLGREVSGSLRIRVKAQCS